eukprot:12733053-Alexandrium_andersonii.AAC.1
MGAGWPPSHYSGAAAAGGGDDPAPRGDGGAPDPPSRDLDTGTLESPEGAAAGGGGAGGPAVMAPAVPWGAAAASWTAR